jgi:TonB family protein
VRVEGALAGRGIRSVPPLPAWTNADILAPSRVRVLVDASGHPMSAVLIESSGLKAADASAVELAQRMSFGRDAEALKQPPGNPDAGLTTGWLIFSWRTLAPTTNGLVNPR